MMTDYMLRMGCAFLTGTLIGIERQCRQRSAGLRTNVLVAVGAAAFTVLSYAVTSPGYGDPTRIAAQIVSGIGFLGGGLILKDGLNVRGLNTAATIWCSAASGTLSGMGMYAYAFIMVAFVLAAHVVLRPLGLFITRRTKRVGGYALHVECSEGMSHKVGRMILDALSFDKDITVNSLSYDDTKDGIMVSCEVDMSVDRVGALDMIVSRLLSQMDVDSARWEKRKTTHEDF